MNKILLLGGAAVAVALLVGKSVYSASRLQFYIGKVGFKLDGFTPEIIIDVMAQNPTGNSFDVASLIGQVFLNNSLIGNVSYYTPTTLAENSQTKIVVPVRLSLLGAASQLIGIFNGTIKAAANLRIVGTANVNHVPAPVDLTYSIV